MTPTFWTAGLISLISSNCSFTGFISVVPVTLVPGSSRLLTTPASTGSVTAVIRIGISSVAVAAAWAQGVAMARIRSTLSATNPSEIVTAVAISPWAFLKSKTTLSPSTKPSSFSPSMKPSLAESRAGCSTIWTMPILYVCGASVPSSTEDGVSLSAGSPAGVAGCVHPAIKTIITTNNIAVHTNFLPVNKIFPSYFFHEVSSTFKDLSSLHNYI